MGSKRIFAKSFTRGKCLQNRYQPFNFRTNGSMTDCIYAKSHCNEEGQEIYKAESSKIDRTCRCDYTKSYAFLKNPKNACFCIPTEEDCSCYVKACPVNLSLSPDYSCTKSGIKQNLTCTEITKFDKTLVDKKGGKQRVMITTSSFLWRNTTDTTILVINCIMAIIVAGGFYLFLEWFCGKLQLLERCLPRNHTAGEGQLNIEENQFFNNAELEIDDVCYLRLVHLLFRVACPVVRLIFNHEIQPNRLRKTLDRKKTVLEKQYRKKEKIINDFQWGLLFGRVKGQLVTSDDFDIGVMICVLGTLTNIEVGDLYPIPSDTRIGSMLSRIKFISNETLRNSEGKLSECMFQNYWEDIAQAVLKLGTFIKLDTKNEQVKTRMIDRLLVLNPITADNKTLRLFIYLSEIYPAMILQQLIYEYCSLNSITIENLLKQEKHQLYHKRIKTGSCCACHTEFSTFEKVIPEKQWKACYEANEGNSTHSCPLDPKRCSECFVPKTIDALDISMFNLLILNIPDIMYYMIQRLCINGFDQFLIDNQHVIYHSMEERMCCKCYEVPAEKNIINKGEWQTLYKKEDTISCRTGNKNCSCQYVVRNGITFTDIKNSCLSKIFKVAGPIAVLNKIDQDAFLYFLNWTADDKLLDGVLKDLLKMINDKMFYVSISSFEPYLSGDTTAKQSVICRWIDKHLRRQEAITEPQLQVLIQDEDGLNVNSVLIPNYFHLPLKTNKFEDLTSEENNYLVVVHCLTKIVYPVIKREFKTQCPEHILDEIRFGIFDNQVAKARQRDGIWGQIKGIQLTPDQQRQLFSQTIEELENLDFELMIYILKKRSNYEWNKVYIDHLDVIQRIRRLIIHSNSGMLDQTRFNDIVSRISKAVLHLGGDKYKDELARLHHIRNIFE